MQQINREKSWVPCQQEQREVVSSKLLHSHYVLGHSVFPFAKLFKTAYKCGNFIAAVEYSGSTRGRAKIIKPSVSDRSATDLGFGN